MTTQIATSVPSKRLAASILSTDLAFTLNNILSWKGVVDNTTNLTAADFGSRAFGVFRNSTNTQMELFEWDPSTVASASITIISRALSFSGGTVAAAVTAYNWNANETIVELGSHTPQLFEQYMDKTSDETVAGVKTFSSLPATTAGNPVAGNDLVNKTYADALANTTTNNYLVVAGKAGETVASGNILYLKPGDNRWWKASSAAASTAENVTLGVAQGAGTAGNAITSGVLLYGLDTHQTGLTADTLYYLSTGGGVSTSPGTKVVKVGFTTTTTALFFAPNFDRLPTKDFQDALAGNSGTPSSTNKYMTQGGFQAGGEIYAADAGSNDTYVITLSPALAAYATGQVFRFKANTINTGAATLNVNSLGAKTIVKNGSATLGDGDIAAGQLVEVIYDGTNMQLLSPVAVTTAYKAVVATRAVDAANGAVTYAHGLGKTPKYVRISAMYGSNLSEGGGQSQGSYDGTTNVSAFRGSNAATDRSGSSSTYGVYIIGNATNAEQKGIITCDGTNVTITWTLVTGSGATGNIYLLIEVEG